MVERSGVMGNHDHLPAESPERNVGLAMQWLNTSCGVCFNLKHGRFVALFQSRFKDVPLDKPRI